MATRKKTEEGESQRVIKDSGNRREFVSGAVRDISEGKGRCDLLPLKEVSELLGYAMEDPSHCDEVIMDIRFFMQTKDPNFLYDAIVDFIGPDDIYTAILDVSKHYEEGAKKYSDRNWEKGIPLHCYIDSGIRHYIKHLRGDEDEFHDRAFIWNMLGAIWTLRNRPEFDDLWEEQDG